MTMASLNKLLVCHNLIDLWILSTTVWVGVFSNSFFRNSFQRVSDTTYSTQARRNSYEPTLIAQQKKTDFQCQFHPRDAKFAFSKNKTWPPPAKKNQKKKSTNWLFAEFRAQVTANQQFIKDIITFNNTSYPSTIIISFFDLKFSAKTLLNSKNTC